MIETLRERTLTLGSSRRDGHQWATRCQTIATAASPRNGWALIRA